MILSKCPLLCGPEEEYVFFSFLLAPIPSQLIVQFCPYAWTKESQPCTSLVFLQPCPSPQDKDMWLKPMPPSPDHTSYVDPLPELSWIWDQAWIYLFLWSHLSSADRKPWVGVMAKGLLFVRRIGRAWHAGWVFTCVNGKPFRMQERAEVGRKLSVGWEGTCAVVGVRTGCILFE